MAGWYFVRLDPSGTVVAVEPNGTEHVVKHGNMNSSAGRALLEVMMRALCCTPQPADAEGAGPTETA